MPQSKKPQSKNSVTAKHTKISFAQKPLSVRETARRLSVHENTVRNYCNRGIIQYLTLPGSGFRRIPQSEVERLLQEMAVNLDK